MSSSMQSHLLAHHNSPKPEHQLHSANDKQGRHEKVIKALIKTMLALIIAAWSFSAVGCSTLQALEPTAILISDIKNSL